MGRTGRYWCATALAVACVIVCPGAAGAAARPLASTASGVLLSWGNNSDGQLGNGSMTDRDLPVKVKLPVGTRITQARSGCFFTVALTTAGEVLAWGLNFDGQLGDGSLTNSDLPVRVHIPAHTTITRVRAGCAFALALTSAGQVLAWGFNDVGQLGDGTVANALTPVQVELPRHTVATGISAGLAYGLALTSSGKVLAWGDDQHGELGDGKTQMSVVPVAVKVPASVHVAAVAAGGWFGLAQTTSGGVIAWGNNEDGMLGDGNLTASDVPVRVKLPHGAKVVQLYAGAWHGLALTASGVTLTWGNNGDGQLGIGSSATQYSDVPVRVQVPSGVTVTGIAACQNGSLAVTSKGSVLAWGDDTFGELGNGVESATPYYLPVSTKLPPGAAAAVVSCGPEANVGLAIER